MLVALVLLGHCLGGFWGINQGVMCTGCATPGTSAVCAGPCCAEGVSVKFGVHSKGKHELHGTGGAIFPGKKSRAVSCHAIYFQRFAATAGVLT